MYASALVFSPARSITRNQFENEEPKWIIRKPAMADSWSACLQTLEDHRGPLYSVAWSHNATRLASASWDSTVKIWDPATGQCVLTIEGHSSSVRSVAWSPDAARLAAALDRHGVRTVVQQPRCRPGGSAVALIVTATHTPGEIDHVAGAVVHSLDRPVMVGARP